MLFKECTFCSKSWGSLEEFLEDPSIKYLGFQYFKGKLNYSIFLFNHDCSTTIGIPVDNFYHMLEGDIEYELQMGREECPGHCLSINEYSDCDTRCSLMPLRKIMQKIIAKTGICGTLNPDLKK